MQPDRTRRPRGSHQLPPGRHGLSRTFVELNQRERILDAVVDVVSLVGYQAMTVEDIIGAAGVSRRTFYDNFKSKDEAFLAAVEMIGLQLMERVQVAYSAGREFAGCVRACLEAFLQFMADEPRYADVCMVEILAAGPDAIARRSAVLTNLSRLLHQGALSVAGANRPPELTAEAIIGGISEVVYLRAVQGATAELPELLPDLAYSMMLPYLGHAAAEREARAVTG